jgi:hypothetical protein
MQIASIRARALIKGLIVMAVAAVYLAPAAYAQTGWGWAYFDGKDRVRTTTTDYTADCKGCHVPVQHSDWIYVEGYPVLRGK